MVDGVMLLAAMASVNFSVKSTTSLTYTAVLEWVYKWDSFYWNVGQAKETDSYTLSIPLYLSISRNHVFHNPVPRGPPSSPGLLWRHNLPADRPDRYGNLEDRCRSDMHLDRCRRVQLWLQLYRVRVSSFPVPSLTTPNHANLTGISYSCNGRCGAGCSGTAVGNV